MREDKPALEGKASKLLLIEVWKTFVLRRDNMAIAGAVSHQGSALGHHTLCPHHTPSQHQHKHSESQ